MDKEEEELLILILGPAWNLINGYYKWYAHDSSLFRYIIFSDETEFANNGKLNIYNCQTLIRIDTGGWIANIVGALRMVWNCKWVSYWAILFRCQVISPYNSDFVRDDSPVLRENVIFSIGLKPGDYFFWDINFFDMALVWRDILWGKWFLMKFFICFLARRL